MSRSGYTDDTDNLWDFVRWRGAVTSAIRGKRGQSFLKEMLSALDNLPDKKLIATKFEEEGAVCVLGAVGKVRGVDMKNIDPEAIETVAGIFGISKALTMEIFYMNDEFFGNVIPKLRYSLVREWVMSNIIKTEAGIPAS